MSDAIMKTADSIMAMSTVDGYVNTLGMDTMEGRKLTFNVINGSQSLNASYPITPNPASPDKGMSDVF